MYEGLQITTNKITRQESKGIPHHLIGCIRLGEEPWTVRNFHAQATATIEKIRARGKIPILVGGTHYYTQTLLFQNSMVEQEQPEILVTRDESCGRPILEAPTEEMLQELRRVDPVMAGQWHPKDRRKIRRSLEIWLETGKAASEIYSEQRSQEKVPASNKFHHESTGDQTLNNLLVFWAHASSAELNERLERRVDAMLSRGLLEEVQLMHDFAQRQERNGIAVDESHGIWTAIGYKEFLPYLNDKLRPETLRQAGIDHTKTATRQYAKRQDQWIRLKLLAAMQDNKQEDKLFLLDASHPSKWSTDVERPAQDITAAFLRGSALPPPRSISQLADHLLATKVKPKRSAHHCEACDKTLMSEEEWINHLESKRHKAATKPKIDWQALYPK